MNSGGGLQMVSPWKAVPSRPSQKAALAQQQKQHQDVVDGLRSSASKKRRVEEGEGQSEAAAAAVGAEAHDSRSVGSSEEANGRDEAENGKLPGWAPPGLGVCQLWAQQASSLKRKQGASASSSSSTSSSSSPVSYPETSSLPASTERRRRAAVAVGFGIDDAVPASREDKAKLVGGYLGTSRPGYGDPSRTPVWWPAEVAWLKGVSISQMNNATLHTLVLAVKEHQRQERRQALASGAELPDGLFAFAPKTKKEMSRLIRSIQGRRLEYGKEGKRPAWWPKDCPWDNHKPLSTMKHAEVTSVFKAMVREGLLSDSDVNAASCSRSTMPPGTGKNNDNDRRAVESQAEDGGEATSDNDCQGGGGGGGGGHLQSTSDSGSDRSSFWDGEDEKGVAGGTAGAPVGEFAPSCHAIDPDLAEGPPLPLPLPLPVHQRSMPSWSEQEHPHQHHLAQHHHHHHHLQQHFQQQNLQRPLEFHGGGGLQLNTPPVAPTTATFPGWAQPLGNFSSHAKVGSFLTAGQVGKRLASTGGPALLESVPSSPARLPPTATPKVGEEGAWQGRALFEDLLFGGWSGPQSCGFNGEDSTAAERMFGFSPLEDDLVFAVGGQSKPLQ